jgi:hypothetical protein
MIRRVFGWFGVAAGAAFGATLAVWAQEPYPLSILERNVLTPEIKPGDPLRIEILADRRKRCDHEVTRFVQEPDGDRQAIVRPWRMDVGRMGRDADARAPIGPGEAVSTGTAICNPWQRWLGSPVPSGDPWRDKFTFAPATRTVKGKYEGEYVR